MNGGIIRGNTADNGGGIGTQGISNATSRPMITMTGGTIRNNEAIARDCGGIFTTRHSTSSTPDYANLNIESNAVFYGNRANAGASAPADRLPNIAVTSRVSIWDYALNNYDINYRGRLGQTP